MNINSRPMFITVHIDRPNWKRVTRDAVNTGHYFEVAGHFKFGDTPQGKFLNENIINHGEVHDVKLSCYPKDGILIPGLSVGYYITYNSLMNFYSYTIQVHGFGNIGEAGSIEHIVSVPCCSTYDTEHTVKDMTITEIEDTCATIRELVEFHPVIIFEAKAKNEDGEYLPKIERVEDQGHVTLIGKNRFISYRKELNYERIPVGDLSGKPRRHSYK